MIDIDYWLKQQIDANGDISQHLLTLKKYAEKCDTVTELGCRFGSSTVAFLSAKPKRLHSFDLFHFAKLVNPVPPIEEAAEQEGIEYRFYEENVLISQNIVDTDLLFIDTLHTYKQLSMEFFLHAHKAKKYIILHDVFLFGHSNQFFLEHESFFENKLVDNHECLSGVAESFSKNLQDRQGLMPAIHEFLASHPEWKMIDLNVFNNGLMVLGRRGHTDVYHGFSNDFLEVNK